MLTIDFVFCNLICYCQIYTFGRNAHWHSLRMYIFWALLKVLILIYSSWSFLFNSNLLSFLDWWEHYRGLSTTSIGEFVAGFNLSRVPAYISSDWLTDISIAFIKCLIWCYSRKLCAPLVFCYKYSNFFLVNLHYKNMAKV
jgi:hypothetical protein